MGINPFKKSTRVYVSTVAYNLNGGAVLNILPTIMLGKTLQGNYSNNGEYIKTACINGSGTNLKRFLNWSQKENSDWSRVIGRTETNFYPDVQLDTDILIAYLSEDLTEDQSIDLTDSYMEFYDYWEIGEGYVINDYPQYIDDNYTIEETQTPIGSHIESHQEEVESGDGQTSYVTVTEEVIDYRTDTVITFSDNTTVTIDSSSYDKETTYIYCKYNIVTRHVDHQTVIIDGRPVEIEVITYTTEPKKLVYGRGSGSSVLDQMMIDVTNDQYRITNANYFPPIPIRYEKHFYSDEYMPEVYRLVRLAGYYCFGYYRALESLIDRIKENDSIDDINHTNIVFGVDITTQSAEGMHYLYEYFYNLWLNRGLIDPEDRYQWVSDWTSAYQSGKQPYTIYIKTNQKVAGFYNKLKFQSIGHFYQTGLIADGAVPGDYGLRWHNHAEPTGEIVTGSGSDSSTEEEVEVLDAINEIWFCKQITSTTFEYIAVAQLSFQVIIHGSDYTYNALSLLAEAYKKRTGETPQHTSWTFKKLIEDKGYIARKKYTFPDTSKEPDASGFIVPLEGHTWMELSLVDQTQLCTEALFVVFNCYKVKRKRWYQRWLMKAIQAVIVIIVFILVCLQQYYATAGLSAAGSAGSAGGGVVLEAGAAGGETVVLSGGAVTGSGFGVSGFGVGGLGGLFASTLGISGTTFGNAVASAVNILAGVAVATAFNILGKMIGGVFGIILRIAGAIIGSYVGAGGSFSLTSMQELFTQPSFYLKCMDSTLQVGQQMQQEQAKLIYQQMNEFNTYSTQQEQRLKDAQYEFRYSSGLDIQYLNRRKRMNDVFWVEGRNTYIDRTIGLIHNFVNLAIDPVCSFCSLSLTLDDKSYLD